MADITSRFVQLKAISPMLVGQSWETRIAADASGALWQSIKGAPYVPLGTRTGLIDGGTSGASAKAAIAQANAAGGGYVIQLGKGTYNLTSLWDITADGIQIIGNGNGSTFINVDDPGGLAGGDAIRLNSVLWAAIKGVTFTANGVQRSAGAMVKVLGRGHITATPAERTNQYTIEDVDAEDMFNGLVTQDGPSSQGAWGGYVNRCKWIRFGAGGVYIWVDSASGGQQFISNVSLYGSAGATDAQRALAAIRYTGGADLEMENVNSIYHRYGFLADPVARIANVPAAVGCLWDNNTRASISLTPTGGGQVLGFEQNGGWGYTQLGLGYACIDISPDAASNADNAKILGGTYWGSLIGCRLNGTNLFCTTVTGADFSACTTGILATGSTTDFILTNNMIGKVTSSVPLVGIQIDAGCDHYNVSNNHLRYAATPLINTPGDSAGRRIATGGNNITA